MVCAREGDVEAGETDAEEDVEHGSAEAGGERHDGEAEARDGYVSYEVAEGVALGVLVGVVPQGGIRGEDKGRLTTAKMVNPKIASLIPNMTPNALSTPTTSFATPEIHPILTANPQKHNAHLHSGACSSLVTARSAASAVSPATRAQRSGLRIVCGEEGSKANMMTMKVGAVRHWRATSQRFHWRVGGALGSRMMGFEGSVVVAVVSTTGRVMVRRKTGRRAIRARAFSRKVLSGQPWRVGKRVAERS